MRHDYELPQCWEAMSDRQKDLWFKGERARRQALRQDTAVARRARELRRRRQRRAAARPETVEVER